MLKQPSAFLPLVMSCAALATVLVHIALFGAVREADEGTAAHIFQLLMVCASADRGVLRDQVAGGGSTAGGAGTARCRWALRWRRWRLFSISTCE